MSERTVEDALAYAEYLRDNPLANSRADLILLADEIMRLRDEIQNHECSLQIRWDENPLDTPAARD